LSVGQRLTQDFAGIKLLGAKVGSSAPPIEAQALDGKTIRLADQRGKLVYVDFWATWCAPCVAEMPNVAKAYEKFNADGLVVIGISFDRDADALRRFVEQRKIPWPQILAEGAERGPLAQAYGVAGIPATFLIGPDGTVLERDLRGERLLQRVEEEIKKLKAAPQAAMARD